jgi:acetyl/propionyl-CoA carboxylase alpha subunit
MRILIANRGEIARRVIRTAHRLGHETIAVYADPDRSAPHVREATAAIHIGPADLRSSYLAVDRLLAAVDETRADAVHPGYGFLSENADFARAVVASGTIWIGPHPDAIDAMGSKINARRLAAAAGVPTIPGYDESQDAADLADAAARIGFPVLVKAAAGGGGKGIRIIRAGDEFEATLREAISEAQRSFGDGRMIVERYIQRPRHVEVQVVGDHLGSVIHLGTRECSVQRRYQKLLEEAPAPNLSDPVRRAMHEAAVALAADIRYDSTGTVEFVVDAQSDDFFFLEMNTRLQVEHPVTELVTGLDLVEIQIRVAMGEPLSLSQGTVEFTGHAIEVRINAEDPANGFTPQVGRVTQLRVPPEVRWESAVVDGDEVTSDYDPMIAKMIVAGPDRESARLRLAHALERLLIGGLTTNSGFFRWLVDQPQIVEGRVTTRFLDEVELPRSSDPPFVEAALAWRATQDEARSSRTTAWEQLRGFRVIPHAPGMPVTTRSLDGTLHEVHVPGGLTAHWADRAQAELEVDDGRVRRRLTAAVDPVQRTVAVNVAGGTHSFTVPTREELWAPSGAAVRDHAGAVLAPFPGTVTEVHAVIGQSVGGGEALVVIEAMKMLHTLTAAGPGVIAEVRTTVGDHVEAQQVLITFELNDAEAPG